MLGVSNRERRSPVIAARHELDYFFGDAETKVKKPKKNILAGETVCARLYLVLDNSIGCPENSKRNGRSSSGKKRNMAHELW
jgi:hypothetical protein